MAIRVTCSGCLTRFDVSERFAGQEGPCPKCKKVIQIPAASEQVVIHAPENFGPKDRSGKATLKPIFRQEAKITPLLMTIVGAVLVALLFAAILMRFVMSSSDADGSTVLPGASESIVVQIVVALGAVAVAIPFVFGGYSVFRDVDQGAFTGSELWVRTAICGLLYAVSWATMWLAAYMFTGYDLGTWLTGTLLMFLAGGVFFMYSFEFDYLIGVAHYGVYFAACLFLRWVAGLGVMPGQLLPEFGPSGTVTPQQVPAGESAEGSLSLLLELCQNVACWLL